MINCIFILILPSTFGWRSNSFPVNSPRDWSIGWTPVHPPGIKSGRCNYFADGDSEWQSWPFSLLLWYVMRTTRLRDCGSCRILLPTFLFLTAVWKVLPLSHSTHLVHVFLKRRESHCYFLGPQSIHCGNYPSSYSRTASRKPIKAPEADPFIHGPKLLLTVVPLWNCSCSS